MDSRALLRRAFPYLVIGIGGFALAYVIIFLFVLPTKIVPGPKQQYTPDSSDILKPIDTSAVRLPDDTGFTQSTVPMAMAPQAAPDAGPTEVPDLTGMALADARSVLDSYRLTARVERDTSSFQPPNTILRQSPAPGSRIPSGGAVTLTASYFPPESGADTTSQAAPLQAAPQPAVPGRAPVPPVVSPRPAPLAPPAGSTGTDSARALPRRPLPPIIPTDSAPATPRRDTTNPA